MSFSSLDRVHARLVHSRALIVFTALTRALLAIAFVPSGLVKLRGERFTTLPVTDPVGYFFDGFFSALPYYQFVGAAQLTAALLLLLPWTAPLGAVIYLPIVLNIFVVTVAVGFGGTAVITGLMLAGSVYLVCWEYDRWKGLITSRNDGRHPGAFITIGLAAAALGGFTGVTQLHLARLRGADMLGPALLVALAASAALGFLWVGFPRKQV